ncbi:SDR family NAD(P)-dependent oxidoreductase [Dongia deserti]|uniref:SDR family NAD(P)-dependent oxidoreductase n=1 Tax=Dongia deserti TaxID=2268030 RepID=UPI000E64CB2D|nr:SDR family NAD(P)-dependent oxidoreductase [Dongia deserti]
MRRLESRVAFVTGAARGIGLAATRALAQEGARVMMCDIDADVLTEAAEQLAKDGLQVRTTSADVSNRSELARAVNAAADAWGRLDILVNNAAITDDTPFEALSAEQWHKVMNVNLDSVLYGAQAAMPHLRRSPCASIINVASIQGLRGQPNSMAYATAKGAVINLTRCMAVDFGPMGIRVNAVAPGYIDTRMALMHGNVHEHQTDWFQDVFIKHGRLPLRRPGKAEDVAGPILFLASDDSRYVTGQALVVDGGLTCTY